MDLFVTRGMDVGKLEVANLPIQEILFLQHDQKFISVHTMDREFHVPGNLSYYEYALCTAGYDFRQVDRNIVVHVPKIMLLDTVFSKAYFEPEIRKNAKSVTLAQVHLRVLKSELTRTTDIVIV